MSLGFLHWLQTEAPTAGGRRGAPELLLRADVMGSADGLSKHPYIRESRRIKAVTTVIEQDVASAFQPGPRARHLADSVGIGWYPIDIHRAGPEDVGVSTRTKPFQTEGVPLAWLIDVGVETREDFVAAQRLFMSGRVRAAADLLFRPEQPITPAEWAAWGGTGAAPASRIAAARLLAAPPADEAATERDPFPVVPEWHNIL